MALFTMLYHYLSRSRYTQKKEKHLILYLVHNAISFKGHIGTVRS